MTEDSILNVPREFLSAAVLIDDELYWDQSKDDHAAEIVEPDEFDTAEADSEPSQAVSSKIDAEQVVDGFSELGLVCATYKWAPGHSTFPNSSEKADLIILDWKLDDQEEIGTTAVSFLNGRLSRDLSGTRRLRYVVIYTDKPKAGVIDKLQNELDVPDNVQIVTDDDSVEIKEDGGPSLWRILYQSKKSVEEKKLAKAILRDFAGFLDGLLPRAVMSGVAELRNRTFEHLYRFNRTVDPAVASHLLAKRSSELEFPAASDAFSEYVIGLIVNDFSDALYGSDLLRKTASSSEVKGRMSTSEGARLRLDGNEKDVSLAQLDALLHGQSFEAFLTTAGTVFGLNAKGKKKLTEGKSSIEFAEVDTLQNSALSNIDQMSRYPRQLAGQFQLKSGVIVKVDGENDNPDRILVCVQPVCDAVRLATDDDVSTRFPFIELEVVPATRKFTFVVKMADEYVYLLTRHKVSELTMASFFASKDSGDVRTRGEGNERHFVDADGVKYQWVSELKEIYAIELQNQLSHQASRIGSDKFEWLRVKTT